MPKGVYPRKRRELSADYLLRRRRLALHGYGDPDDAEGFGCWEFAGARNSKGYGHFGINRRMFYAHRVAAMLWLGFDLESNLQVCHHCDNPPCFNPAHLFIGTSVSNAVDALIKGRTGPAKLSRSQVEQIIRALQLDEPQHAIAARFEVSEAAVARIARCAAWRHVLPGELRPSGVRAGERHPNAVLTAAAVREIRSRCAAGEPQTAIAASLGISQKTVSLISRRVTWRHVV